MLRRGLVFLMLIVCALAWAGWASSKPEITYMRTCQKVIERATSFEASGWISAFSEGNSVYCVVKLYIPFDSPQPSYSASLRWYTPAGELYSERKFDDLERKRGSARWSLWDSIENVNLAGYWRVTFSVQRGPTKTVAFSVGSVAVSEPISPPPSAEAISRLSTPSPTPEQEPEEGEKAITGREQEPNDAAGAANLLAFDEKVQGEVLFYSEDVYDQDWYRIELAGNEEYWLEVNAVGMTSQWLSPFSFLGVYVYQEAALVPMSLPWEAQQEVSEDRSLCDAVAPIQGPGTYYIFILAKDCEHDIYYSLQIATSKPEVAEGES